jgi:4'-phosphopantetheinyl transferase
MNTDNIQNPTVHPVILSVPEQGRCLRGRERVKYLSAYARYALELSAEKSRIPIGDLLKDKNGSPLPFKGNYWSLAHKPQYVAGVVAPARIGIDLEEIRPPSEALFKKIADEKEWALSTSDSVNCFFRYWTSKEAVLKATGIGLKGLSRCRIKRILDDNHLIINYMEQEWAVEQIYFDRHIASVVKNRYNIKWTF